MTANSVHKHSRGEASPPKSLPQAQCSSKIGRLPDALQSHLFGFLSLYPVYRNKVKGIWKIATGDFSKLAEVSKYWYQKASDSHARAIALKNQEVPRGISHVQNLRLFNALDGTFLTSDKIFTLDVRGMIMNEQLFGLCQRMLFGTLPSLKQLNINNLQGPCSSQFFGLLPKIFPQLKALEMHSADVTMETVKTTFPAMTNLECLSFTCYRSLETFLSTLPNLRSLRVTLQEMPEPMAIRHTALRRLHIKWDSEEPLVSGSEREIVHLFDCCPNLEELIMEMPLVVDSFQYITNYFPKLKKLVVLTQVPACLEEQLPVFAKKHPYLELLEIMGMRMEASTYLKIIDACPSLKQTLVKEFVNWENVLWTNEQFDTFFHDKVFFSYALTKISHLKIESSEGTLLSLRLAADHLPNIKNFSIIVRNEIPVADLEYLLTHTEANVQLDVTAADPQDVKERGLKLFTRFPRLHVVSNPQL